MPDMQPTVRHLTKVLLGAAESLTNAELAERADVSTRSVRTHLPRLEALGLVERSDAGARFALPFATGAERGQDTVPGLLEPATTPTDCLYALGEAIAGEAVHAYDSPVGAAFFEDDPLDALRELAVFERWIPLACRLDGSASESEARTAQVGPRVEQTALQEVAV